jgi:mannose-1-phosphate guanylyltransferase
MKKNEKVWSIILAAGEGDRLRPSIQSWLGYHKPKQYCTFVGTRSMLQHTLDRADRISPPEQKITVVARDHFQSGWTRFLDKQPGKALAQPANRGTASAIFLALAYIRKRQPDATVVIYPSDHFIYPEADFAAAIGTAVSAAQAAKHWLTLIGISPEGPEPEYGWIQPGIPLGWINGHRLRIAESFVEKPTHENCRKAMAKGALWNTMILAADLKLLWEQGYQNLPDVMPQLEKFQYHFEGANLESALELLYQDLPFCDFSSAVLQHIPHRIAVLELSGVLWSDWGRAERIVKSLDLIGKSPSFRLAQVAS